MRQGDHTGSALGNGTERLVKYPGSAEMSFSATIHVKFGLTFDSIADP